MRVAMCRLNIFPLSGLIFTLIINLFLGLVSSDKVLAASLDGWPVLRHDHGHSGYNADVGVFRPPLAFLDTIDLEYPTADPFSVLNLITGPQRIYAMAQSIIWGVDKANPLMQWYNDDCLPTEGDPGSCFINYVAYATEAFAEDRLVVIRQNFNFLPLDFGFDLVILDATNGEEIWSKPLGDTAPEIALEGSRILLLTEEDFVGKLTKLTLSGTQEFKENADISGFPGSRAVVGGGLFIYVNDDTIHAYSTNDGQPSWAYTPGFHDDTQGYDLVATADAVIMSQDERVIKLDINDGSLLWEKDIKPVPCDSNTSPNAATTDGTTIAITAVCDDEVVTLNYTDGAEKWRKSIGLQTASAHAIGGNTLYVASVTSPLFNIYAFDPDSNVELEKMELHIDDFHPSSILAISDGLMLIASNLGSKKIHRFERTPADISVEFSAESQPVCGASVGGTLTYNFLVTNNGPGATDNTRVKLSLPSGVKSIDVEAGSCTTVGTPVCELGPLSVGQKVRITANITLTKDGVFKPGIRVLHNVSGSVRDPNDTNDSVVTEELFTVGPELPEGFDLLLTDIEITQGIQNLANEVPLVEGKQTFVRVYGRTNGEAVNNVSAILHGEVVDTGADLGTLNAIQGAACLSMDGDIPDRDQLNKSFVFELPKTWWKGAVIFTAEINPDGAIPDSNDANDTLAITRGFTRLPRICLKTYPVRTAITPVEDPGGTDDLRPTARALADDTGNILSRALTMLPVREIKVYPESDPIEEVEVSLDGLYGPYEMLEEEDNRVDVLDTLDWIWLVSDDPDECDADDSRTHYVGMIHRDTTNTVGSAGLGERPGEDLTLFLNTGRNGPQRFDDPHGGLTLAHELGHNYDRKHVDCGDPKPEDVGSYPGDRDVCDIAPNSKRSFYGLEFRDTTNPTVITPTMAGDVMSYADDVWTSEFTWEAIQDVLCAANNCTFSAQASLVAGAVTPPPPITGDVLLVRGRISPTMGITQTYRLPVSDVPKANRVWAEQIASRPQEVIYALNLVGAGDIILHSEPFSPKVVADQNTTRSSFRLVIPWNPDTIRIELIQNGVPVDSLVVSPSPPVVTSISPDGGEVITGDELLISWTATDADGDDLYYTVLYSNDNGSSWRALVAGGKATDLNVDSSLLPGCTAQCLVKVIASDGLNSSSRQSAAPFSMPDRTPNAFIYFPDDGDVYTPGSSITARGGVYDPEDDYLLPDDMNWELSGHGFLGTGESIVLPDLPDGEYTLTLSATDSNAQDGSLSINFTIGPEPEFESSPVASDTLAFGDQPVLTESAPMLVQISNLGDADLTLGCSLSGADATSFKIKSCPTPIVGAGSGDISISCLPESLGAKSAILNVITNDSDEPSPSYNLTCAGIEAPPEETIFADGFEG